MNFLISAFSIGVLPQLLVDREVWILGQSKFALRLLIDGLKELGQLRSGSLYRLPLLHGFEIASQCFVGEALGFFPIVVLGPIDVADSLDFLIELL